MPRKRRTISGRTVAYLVAAAAIAAAILLLERPGTPRVDDSQEAMLIPGYDSAEVFRIEVAQLLSGVSLKRTEEGWLAAESAPLLKVELYEREGREIPKQSWAGADGSRVAMALGGFGGLRRGVVVSTNPERRELYQVGASGLSVLLIDSEGRQIADIVIGKSGPDLGSTYVRAASEEEVLLAPRPLVGLFSPVVDDWLIRDSSAK